MNYLDQYIIQFSGLDNDKEYSYNFIVGDAFFLNFEKSDIKGGNLDISVDLLKKSRSLTLNISLKGYANIVCDRCLDIYIQDINFKDSILVMFADETNFDTNEDYITLDHNLNEINISQFIYEFANFALPFVHYHPLDKNKLPTCNPEMLKLIEKHSSIEQEGNTIDIRWEKLIDLKNNYINNS